MTTPSPTSPTCLDRFTVEHSRSVLSEQRSTGPGWDDFPTRFAAAVVDPATFLPVKAVADYRVNGQPILFFTPDRRAAVVDARLFSDLVVADPTRMRAGETASVGAAMPAARQALTGREIARFLILAGVVRVYWHVEAEVCLETETTKHDGAYEAAFSGTHTYFTNQRHEGHFAFTMKLAPDGNITVVNRL
jgi:hypothetical protein